MVKAEIWTQDSTNKEWHKDIWHYEYDALDRRIAKYQEIEVADENNVSDNPRQDSESAKTEYVNHIEFVWDGSHLLQEIHDDSYKPSAQIIDYRDESKAQKSTTPIAIKSASQEN